MCRLQSCACLLLLAAILTTLCHPGGAMLSKLPAELFADLRLPQSRAHAATFWSNDADADVDADAEEPAWPLGRPCVLGVATPADRGPTPSAGAYEVERHGDGDVGDPVGYYTIPAEDLDAAAQLIRTTLEDIDQEADEEMRDLAESERREQADGEVDGDVKEASGDGGKGRSKRAAADGEVDGDVKEASGDGGKGRSKRAAGDGAGDAREGKREATRSLSGPKRAPDFHSWGGKRASAKTAAQADVDADEPWGGKRAPAFNSWGGKRAPAFNSWGGKRAPEFNSWGGKRSPAFNSWGGKRAPAFNSWGGKRAPEFNSWGGKRAPEFNSWGGKRAPAFNSWGGKRAPEFNSWGGKRAPEFNSWGGKRAPEFNSWGGKRSPEFNSWGGKRSPAFNSWGGKRAPEFNSWGGKRAPDFNSWGGKRAPAFNSWGGKRSTHPSQDVFDELKPAPGKEEATAIALEAILQNQAVGGSSPLRSLKISKRSTANDLGSPSDTEIFLNSKAADFYAWGG